MTDSNSLPTEIYKETSSLGRLLIKPVDKATAKEMIAKHHYSHKWNDGGFGVYNFGIFRADEPDRCLGVAVYGYMKNPKARIFTHPNPKAWMCELNRMWIDDELGHNAESILIAASIKLLRRLDPDLVSVRGPPFPSQSFCAIDAAARWYTSRYSPTQHRRRAFYAPMSGC